MSDFIGESNAFAPKPNDSIRELRWKAESMLEYLRENDARLRRFPGGLVDERRALWQPLADLLEQAMENPELATDARLETHRVWAEEVRRTAMFIVTIVCACAFGGGPPAFRRRFGDTGGNNREDGGGPTGRVARAQHRGHGRLAPARVSPARRVKRGERGGHTD